MAEKPIDSHMQCLHCKQTLPVSCREVGITGHQVYATWKCSNCNLILFEMIDLDELPSTYHLFIPEHRANPEDAKVFKEQMTYTLAKYQRLQFILENLGTWCQQLQNEDIHNMLIQDLEAVRLDLHSTLRVLDIKMEAIVSWLHKYKDL